MITNYVYFVRVDNSVKIGVAKDVPERIETIQTHNPGKVKFVMAIQCSSRKQAMNLESRIHHWQRKHKIRGEWFRPECIEGFKKNIWKFNGSSKLIESLDTLPAKQTETELRDEYRHG